jgi:adenine-specific DNA methylase
MIPRDCKRLAEVDFPIAVVSRHAAREKSVRHGQPSTLHLWWARRPLASSRAMLLGLLLPDPADANCPPAFRADARAALRQLPNMGGARTGDNQRLRAALLRFLGDCADWRHADDAIYVTAARALIRAAHGDDTPLVADPFAGGGSIPLEALRLGCDAYASDINPVACLILKTMLEDMPRSGSGLAAQIRAAGGEIKAAAEQELGCLYPLDPDGSQPIAYLWARTVRCESSDCGAEIPLVRSFWLAKRKNRPRALGYDVERPQGGPPRLAFKVFEPSDDSEVPRGTVHRATASCACCGLSLAADRVRVQLRIAHGGADVAFDKDGRRIGGATLLAVVSVMPDQVGRRYRTGTSRDLEAVHQAQLAAARQPMHRGQNVSPFPDEPTPKGGGSGAGRAFSIRNYGMNIWSDLFTCRQKLAAATIASLTARRTEGPREALAFAVSRLVDKNASLAVWNNVGEKIEHVYGRQALPIVWDFAEVAIFSNSTGNYLSGVELVAKVASSLDSLRGGDASVHVGDARQLALPDESVGAWVTDPPYYDAIPYADLSDFFFVWLKRALPDHRSLRDPRDPANPLTPKTGEIVQDETKTDGARPKDRVFFESAMAQAFAEGRRVTREDGIGSVVFAHKTTEGWEALLSGLIRGGWTITASWPIATERPGRLRAQNSAALATSVHLVCRPRVDNRIGDWGDVLRELPRRVADWMERLQAEGVRGADLVFACIGPALEIFSRYEHVETPDGTRIVLGDYLAKVWEVVGRTALEQILGTAEAKARNGGAGALEEDARLSALFLWTLQSDSLGSVGSPAVSDPIEPNDSAVTPLPRGFALPYDVVRRFAQPLGIHLDTWNERIIEIQKGAVRLLPVAERAHQLFGAEGISAIAAAIERDHKRAAQLDLFPEPDPPPRLRGPSRNKPRPVKRATNHATTLDRVHAAMLLQRSGQTNALRALLRAEAEQGKDFERLSTRLSALYPKEAEEKRLLDAMMLAMPR